MTMRLYPSRFEAPTQPEAISGDGWNHSDHAQPASKQAARRVTQYLIAALAGFIGSPFVEVAAPPTGDGTALASTVQTSVRFDKTIVYQDLAYTPYIPPADVTVATTNTTVRHRKTIIYDDLFYTPYVVAETVTLDKWFQELEQPTRRTVSRQGQHFAFNTLPLPSLGWQQPPSQPTRRKVFLEGDYTQAPTQAQHNDGIGWHRPFSDPTRRVTTRQQQDHVSGPELPITSTLEYGWLRPLSEPTRVKVRQNQGSFVYPYQTIVVGTPGDDTTRPFTDTTSVRYDRTIQFQDFAYAPYTPAAVAAEEIVVASSNTVVRSRKTIIYDDLVKAPEQPKANDGIGWHRPFSEPTRRKPFLEADVAWSSWVNQTGTGTAYNWFVPLEIPSRLAARRVVDFPSFSYSPYFVPPVSGVGTEYNWWSNLSERIRVRSPVTQQQAVIQGPAQPITVTLEYGWHRPFSERLDRAKRVSEFPSQAYSPYFPPSLTGTGTEYNWWSNLSERIRRHQLGPDRQQAVIQGTQFPIVDVAWHRPLSEPTRRKVKIANVEGSCFYQGDFVTTYAWRQPLSEPVRAKPKQHQSTFYTIYIQPTGNGNGTTQPWPEWSRPTRRVTNKQLWAGITWTSIFQLGDYDPGRMVCVSDASRQVTVNFNFDVTPLDTSTVVNVPLESRVVDVAADSRTVTVPQEPSCQDS